MSKKFGKKLSVTRQTLARLDQDQLGEVQGGVTHTRIMCLTKVWTCQHSCVATQCRTEAESCMNLWTCVCPPDQ